MVSLYQSLQDLKAGMPVCPRCGNLMDPGQSLCVACCGDHEFELSGIKVISPVCPRCGDEIDPEQVFCVECCDDHEYDLADSDQWLCRHCGKASPLNHYRSQQRDLRRGQVLQDGDQVPSPYKPQVKSAEERRLGKAKVGYVITKVSKAGVRYFFTGKADQIEAADGETIDVARTSLFFGDAKIYSADEGMEATGAAAFFNINPVSDAEWQVEPAAKFRTQWGLGE